jgi:hypothetical protein
MSLDRRILRAQAKKEYKKIIKGIPKSRRMPFSEVYKVVAESLTDTGVLLQSVPENPELDSDISDMIMDNVNETSNS